MIEQLVNIDRMEHALALFGSFDENVRLIEQEYSVTVTCRGTEIKVFGDEEGVSLAVRAITGLLSLINKGESLTEQNIRYVMAMVSEGREDKDGEEAMTHTASMESCIADLDLLMCSRNRSDDAEDRRARVQAERDKLTEKLRAKTQEAKELREARTGEIAPITEEIIDDGAGDL